MPVVTPGAAVEGRLVDEEAGLAPDVELADDLGGVPVLDAGVLLAMTAVAAAAVGERPGDLKAVAVADALVVGNRDVRREIDVDSKGRHGRRPKRWVLERMPRPSRHPYRKSSQERARGTPENAGVCTLNRKSPRVAHYALDNDLTLKEAALKLGAVSAAEFDRIVDPRKMTEPYVAVN